MPDWADKIIEFVKLPIKYIWVTFIFCGIFLFLPVGWIEFLGLDSLNEKYRTWIGPVFVFSFCMVVVDLFLLLKKKMVANRAESKRQLALIDSLSKLDPHEQSILREFYIQQRKSIQLPYDNPTVSGMLRAGLLKLSGNTVEVSLAGQLMSMQINPEIQDIVTFEEINLPENEEPTDQQVQWVRKNRPDFMYEIEHHNDLFHKHWSRRI